MTERCCSEAEATGPVAAWFSPVRRHLEGVMVAMQSMVDDADDLVAMREDGDNLVAHAAAILAALPSPDPALTAALETAMIDYRLGAQACATAIDIAGSGQMKLATSYLERGNAAMVEVARLLDGLVDADPRQADR